MNCLTPNYPATNCHRTASAAKIATAGEKAKYSRASLLNTIIVPLAQENLVPINIAFQNVLSQLGRSLKFSTELRDWFLLQLLLIATNVSARWRIEKLYRSRIWRIQTFYVNQMKT